MNLALSEYLTAQFYAWEKRGRGWEVFDQPVHLEPIFIPFFKHSLPEWSSSLDDGERPRFFPGLQEALGLFKKPDKISEEEVFQLLEEKYPIEAYVYENSNPVVELQVNFDQGSRVVFENIEQLLLMLSTSRGIVGFEIVGTKKKVSIQFICTDQDPANFKSFISTYAPGVVVHETPTLMQALDMNQEMFVIDLGLRDEFMRPLRVWHKFDPDPLSGCIAAMESL